MSKTLSFVLLLCFCSVAVNAKIFLHEKFNDDSWSSRWISSTVKGSELGKLATSSGEYFLDASNKGLKTTQDARFYQVSTPFTKFSNKGKDLVVQLQVKHEQSIDCGGGYIKIFPSTLKPKEMVGESPYNIMFGPDICGPTTRKVHVILSYKGENHLVKKDIRCKDDVFSHVYTLLLKPDNTYKVFIDFEEVAAGKLEEDWDLLKPKEILDPKASKPVDWDDNEKIPDPEDSKPKNWDDEPATIPDNDAKKPDDWDDEMDGEWEAPVIPNPAYKGEWSPKMIPNPDYKGVWEHPKIANPEYKADKNLYSYDDFGHVGIDIWQVKSGTIFDDIILGDNLDEVFKLTKDSHKKLLAKEQQLKESADAAAKKLAEEVKVADDALKKPASAEKEEEEIVDDVDHDEL